MSGRVASGLGADIVVVKLGGSLMDATAPRIRPPIHGLLDVVARARRPVVIAPGGGAFADLVRTEQTRLGLSDASAHRMALLAMHQMASAIVDLQPRPSRFTLAASLDDIAHCHSQRLTPVWQPLPMLDSDCELPQDWSITSDGIAAWLGGQLGAKRVVLVKSVSVAEGASAGQLARDGVVDPMFEPLIARAGLAWTIIGPGEEGRLAELIGADMQPDAAA